MDELSTSPPLPKKKTKVAAEDHAMIFYNLSEPRLDLNDLLTSDVCKVIATSMNLDLEWLLSAMPHLAKVPLFLSSHPPRCFVPSNVHWIDPKPLLPQYGCAHGKLFVLFSSERSQLRVVVSTANLIESDYVMRQNGFWTQDFPRKTEGSARACPIGSYNQSRNDFEAVLVDYLGRLGMPQSLLQEIGEYDFSGAKVALVTSVPGTHVKASAFHYGMKRVRRLLDVEGATQGEGPVFAQITSVGATSPDYRSELAKCFGATTVDAIWPSLETIRNGKGGYEDGTHICLNARNAHSDLLKWEYRGRGEEISPHIKTFFRFASKTERTLAFFYLGSHNLSKSAWGHGMPNEQQHTLVIKSFELGVVFLPQLASRNASTPVRWTLEDFCIPYQFPPAKLTKPWCWDVHYAEPDKYGFAYASDKSVFKIKE